MAAAAAGGGEECLTEETVEKASFLHCKGIADAEKSGISHVHAMRCMLSWRTYDHVERDGEKKEE